MASKKRQGKKNSGAGNPAKAEQRGRSVHKIQAELSVDALRGQYVAWVAAQVPAFSPADAAQAAEIQLDVIRTIGGEYAETARSSNLFDLDPEIFGQALADFLVNLPDNVAPEPIFSTWLDFFSFAEDRQLWQGGAENLEEVRELLEDALDGFAEGDAEICALLRATPLFDAVKNFAVSIGDGIPTNDLTDSDSSSRVQVFEAMGIDAQSVEADAPAPLRFNYIWNAAMMSVVTTTETSIVRDEEAFAEFLDGEQADSAQLLFEMAVACVQAHLNPTMDSSLRDEAHYLVVRNLLVTASTGRDGDLEGLRRNVGAKIYDSVLPEATEAMASLAGFGLLQRDGQTYSIDERLVPVVSAGISEVEAFFEEAV